MAWDRIFAGFPKKRFLVLFLHLVAGLPLCFAQEKTDTTDSKNLVERVRENKTAQRIMNNFIRKQDTLFNVKSEDPLGSLIFAHALDQVF